MRRRHFPPGLSSSAFVLLTAVFATGEEGWPRFRGPNGSGVGSAPGVACVWTEANTLWTAELGGVGHGSPVVWGDRVFLLTGDNQSGASALLAIDASTGDELWRETQPGGERPMHAANSYASTTPVVDAERVYLTGATPSGAYLAAYSHDGAEQWRRQLGPYESSHGFASSPVLAGGFVCIADDQLGESALIAFKPATGEIAWRAPRPSSDKSAYSTPCVATTLGREALVTMSKAAGMAAYDAANGDELWRLPDAFPARCVSSPVAADGLVFGACGGGGGGKQMVAVPLGDEPPTGEAYTMTRSVPYVPTPLVVGDLMFLWHDRGTVACAEVATGKKLWEERVGGKYYGSPVAVEGAVLAVSRAGEVVIVAADPLEGRVIARNPLGEPSHATPAIAHGRLYVRTESKLFCIAGIATARADRPTDAATK